jgi:hypothetical protein
VVDHAELLQRMGESPVLARTCTRTEAIRGWPPQVLLGHLAYVEHAVWLPRLKAMDADHPPTWDWWEPQGVDWSGLYGGRTYADVADEFELARNETVAYLGALPDEDWARRARHAVFGELAVAGLCEEILAHDHEHLADLVGS